MLLATIKVIADTHEIWVVYFVLQFQTCESHHLVERGMLGIFFFPGELKPFRDLNIPTVFSFRSPARNASGFIQFRGVCVSACRCVRWQGGNRQRIIKLKKLH